MHKGNRENERDNWKGRERGERKLPVTEGTGLKRNHKDPPHPQQITKQTEGLWGQMLNPGVVLPACSECPELTTQPSWDATGTFMPVDLRSYKWLSLPTKGRGANPSGLQDQSSGLFPSLPMKVNWITAGSPFIPGQLKNKYAIWGLETEHLSSVVKK